MTANTPSPKHRADITNQSGHSSAKSSLSHAFEHVTCRLSLSADEMTHTSSLTEGGYDKAQALALV